MSSAKLARQDRTEISPPGMFDAKARHATMVEALASNSKAVGNVRRRTLEARYLTVHRDDLMYEGSKAHVRSINERRADLFNPLRLTAATFCLPMPIIYIVEQPKGRLLVLNSNGIEIVATFLCLVDLPSDTSAKWMSRFLSTELTIVYFNERMPVQDCRYLMHLMGAG